MAMTTHVIFCIMTIHGHCTLIYLGLLYVLAGICRVVLLYYADWVVGLPFGIVGVRTLMVLKVGNSTELWEFVSGVMTQNSLRGVEVE